MKNITIILLLACHCLLNAQNAPSSNISVGYFGETIFVPGLKISYEKSAWNWTKETKRNAVNRSFQYGVDCIYYQNKDHHHGIVAAVNFSYKKEKNNTRFIQFKWLSGIHRSFADGVTYQANEGASFSANKWGGQNTFYNSMSFLFGRKITDQIGYYGELGINGRYPYNHSLLKSIHAGIGIQYFIN